MSKRKIYFLTGILITSSFVIWFGLDQGTDRFSELKRYAVTDRMKYLHGNDTEMVPWSPFRSRVIVLRGVGDNELTRILSETCNPDDGWSKPVLRLGKSYRFASGHGRLGEPGSTLIICYRNRFSSPTSEDDAAEYHLVEKAYLSKSQIWIAKVGHGFRSPFEGDD
jgi:hypothetical protein